MEVGRNTPLDGLARTLTGWLVSEEVSLQRDTHQPRGVEGEVTRLFHEYRSPLLRYTLALGLPVAEGEDVVQEAFLALFRHLVEDKPQANLRGWIFRVGHNLALRRRQQMGRIVEGLEQDTRVDPDLNPEEHAAWRRRQARLQSVLDALPERDRCCLLMRAEGLRYREIAEAMEISLGAVAISLSRSLARLGSVEER